MLTKENIISTIELNRIKIKSFGVTKLTLFGSYARDEATVQSDIDFLVEFKEGRGLFDDCFDLTQFLNRLFGQKIDIVKTYLIREELKKEILGGAQIEAKV